ncbi:MAG: PQQ-dependent sugar dehydrogenase [Bacteroidetes bacterium]|nr:PQQ-dependent sugar dehydrogenase [Bacteroidota bacterium]
MMPMVRTSYVRTVARLRVSSSYSVSIYGFSMRALLPLLCAILLAMPLPGQVDFTSRPVAENLNIPWDLVEGPDGYIWYTERIGLISRVHPETHAKDTLLDFRGSVANSVEIGLLGMVLHPDFSTQPYVFAAYAFRDADTWVKRVFRGRYDGTKIVDVTTIYELRPAQQYHQGCRLIILPDTTLMFTNGDQPSADSTFSLTSEIGKTIRINLDGTVPPDNPFPGSKIWSTGHRNPQGMCQLPNGFIYSSEHGEAIEDEINLIRKGANYGWPKVEGKCDTPVEIAYCAAYNVVEPVWSSGTKLTYAPSGLEFYPHTRYPALTGKLLGVFLKAALVMAYDLSPDQTRIVGEKHMLLFRFGRLRDILVMSDGRLFVCTGNYGAKGIAPFPKPNHDVIVELLPVWAYEQPKVRIPADTVVYRADVGDTLTSSVEFCNDGATPAFFTRFNTNPGNIFEARFWQDGASVEGTDCYPFRVLFIPQADFPYRSSATVYYANPGEAEQSRQAVLIGLPKRGYVRATRDTFSIATGMTVQCSVRNIGLDTTTVSAVQFDPPGSATSTAFDVPVRIAPDEVRTFPVTLSTPMSIGSSIRATLRTNSFRDATFVISVVPTHVDDVDADLDVVLAPQPIKDVLRLTLPDSGTYTMEIHDVVGKLIYAAEHNGTSVAIPVASFPTSVSSGVYSVSITSRGRTQTLPFHRAP